MFERFTDRARRVVVLAQEEARLLNHDSIGTEHLLLGMLHEGDGIAAKALSKYFTIEDMRQFVVDIVGSGVSGTTGHAPFTPRSKKVLELSLREALQLGHNYVGPEHLLLGLIREGDGVAAHVIQQRVLFHILRQDVIKILSDNSPLPTRKEPTPRPSNIIGEVIGADFTKRDDGKIVLHVTVPEDFAVKRRRVVFFPELADD